MKQNLRLFLLMLLTAVFSSSWADNVTDVLNQTFTGVTGTSYTNWSGKKATSDAVYAGNSAGGNSSIQLRTNNNNSGVVTTTSGGKVKSITVVWNSNTASGRTLDIYGKNSAYGSAADLYNSSNQGTKLGSITNGTSTSLTITGDYQYIGFRSNKDAMYLTSVSIVWETSNLTPSGLVYATETVEKNLGDAAFTNPLTNPNNLTVAYSSSKTAVATVATNGEVTIVGAGETTITATFAGNTTYEAGSASYTLKVIDPNAPGATAENPYTVAQARAAIDAGTGVTGVYATGIVSKIVTTLSNGQISYNISSDGKESSDQLQVYKGKGIEGANFTSDNDVRVGDSVVVYGDLTKYNSIYEFAQNNKLVFIKHNSKLNAGLDYATATVEKNMGEAAFTNELTNPNNLSVTYSSSATNVATVATNGEVTIVGAGETTITATFAGNDDYEAGWASYSLTVTNYPTVIDLRGKTDALTFDLASFPISGGYATTETAIKLTGSDNETYVGWKAIQVYKNSGGMQMKGSSGKLTSPQILSDKGVKIKITKNTATVGNPVTITAGETSSTDSLSTNSTETNFILQAGSNFAVVLSITITPLTEAAPEPAGLSYPVDSYTATIGETNEFPVLSNPNELEGITYSSSNTSVATIDASTGAITLVAPGTTKITATFEANASYLAGSASYTLKVKENVVLADVVIGNGIYQKITSTDDLEAGHRYLIVYETLDNDLNNVANAYNGISNTSTKYGLSSESIAIGNDNKIEPGDVNVHPVVLQVADNGNWYIMDGENFLTWTSGNNLNIAEETSANTKWTIGFDEGGDAIVANVANSDRIMRYNSSNPRFACYTSGQDPISLYKELIEEVEETIPVTISSAGYATLYYSDKSLKVPEGVTAYTVTVEGKNIVLNDNLGSVIPAGFGVVLEADEGNYDFIVTEGPADEDKPEPGALEGTDEATTISDGTSKYYVLSLNQNGDEGSIGFYYDPTTNPADGSSVNNGAHKAYLKVDASNSASAYPFNTTGIRSITTTAVDSGEVYTLSGIRVKGQLNKGIYIVNGKKMVIK